PGRFLDRGVSRSRRELANATSIGTLGSAVAAHCASDARHSTESVPRPPAPRTDPAGARESRRAADDGGPPRYVFVYIDALGLGGVPSPDGIDGLADRGHAHDRRRRFEVAGRLDASFGRVAAGGLKEIRNG